MPLEWRRRLARALGIPDEDAGRVDAVLQTLENELRRIGPPDFTTQPATVFEP